MSRKKKSGFLTFCFSLLPGAGEMYLGFMKMGISLMGMFFGIVAVGGFLNLASVMLIDVVLWFYSFFHVHNLAGMTDEEFLKTEDTFLFHLDEILDMSGEREKYRKVVAIILIAAGILLFWSGWKRALMPWIPDALLKLLSRFENTAPRMLVGIAIIIGGVHMIKGKKEELEDVIIDIDAREVRTESRSGGNAKETGTGLMPAAGTGKETYGAETEREDS